MISSIFVLFLFYSLIILAVLGYGLFFERLIYGNNKVDKLGYTGLLGIFFLIIYSYISHFFLSHNLFHNSLVIIIGLIISIFYVLKIYKNFFFNILFVNFLILFIALLIYKTHDDFPYYHFPYSYYLTQFPMLIGVGQFNHGFRTPSSIFYLNSLFYLPLIKYFTFYIGTILIMGFANLILISRIYRYFIKKKINSIFYLSILIFIFINIFFYRIQEHGTDRSAQILILILFLQTLLFLNLKKNIKSNINHILVILGLIISLKAFYVLYLIFLFPILWILYKNKKLIIVGNIFKNWLFYSFLLILILIIIVNFFNTGCLMYPASVTCFENFDWSLGKTEAIRMNDHYQLWSKGGHNPNFKVDDPSFYLQDFNWVDRWFKNYFLNKVSDLILGLIFVILFLTLTFYNKNYQRINFNKNNFLIYSVTFLLFFEWFYFHPALRYGGYCLIALIIFFPSSLLLEKFNNPIVDVRKKLLLIASIVIVVFLSRNIVRLDNEVKKYGYQPIKNSFYKIDKGHFRIDKNFNFLINNFENCKENKNICDIKTKLKVKEFFNKRYIFIRNQ